MASSDEKREQTRRLTEKFGYAAAAITLIPIPGTEVVAVVPLHVGMVVQIGNIYGREITRDGATELLLRIGTTVGISLVGSRLATTAAKFILPGLGGIISAPFMYASTLAIGAVARAWCEMDADLTDDVLRNAYKQANKAARSTFDPSKMRSDEAKNMAKSAAEGRDFTSEEPKKADPTERLAQLKKLVDAGLIEAEEYESTKQRILSEL